VHDVIPVEYGEEVSHRFRRVALARFDVLPKDAPGVLNGTQQRLLVRGIDGQRNSIEPRFKAIAADSFPCAPIGQNKGLMEGGGRQFGGGMPDRRHRRPARMWNSDGGLHVENVTSPQGKLLMAVLETLKRVAEKATGLARPSRDGIERLVRIRKAKLSKFKDDGVIPNNTRWPLVLYQGAISLPGDLDAAAIMEDLFDRNGWGDSWRNGIYDYVHYHSRIHEVLGVARGKGGVRFGGNNGRTFQLKAGDVAILPAGTGHQCLAASADFLVVGAYPPSGTYDECTKSEEHAQALKTIPKVGRPRKDPVYGAKGPLLSAWKPLR
jgi:uncharacterized protein YjlB